MGRMGNKLNRIPMRMVYMNEDIQPYQLVPDTSTTQASLIGYAHAAGKAKVARQPWRRELPLSEVLASFRAKHKAHLKVLPLRFETPVAFGSSPDAAPIVSIFSRDSVPWSCRDRLVGS